MGRKRTKLDLSYLPGIALIAVVILGGFIKTIIISFGFYKEIGISEFTTKYYREIFTSKGFLNSLFFTFKFAAISSILAVIIGLFMAYGIYFYKKKSSFSLNIPMIIPHMIVVVILLNLFSEAGLFSRILANIGIIDSPHKFVPLFYTKSAIGIILVYIFKGVPFAAVVFLNGINKIGMEQFSAARNLGATESYAFYHIYYKRVKSSLLKVLLILFTFSMSSYEVPYLIGPTTPRALAVKSYIEFTQNDFIYKPYSLAYNVILGLIGIITVIVFLMLEFKDDEDFI